VGNHGREMGDGDGDGTGGAPHELTLAGEQRPRDPWP